MTYSDVALLIDQYGVIPPEHAKVIADAMARKGYRVTIEEGPFAYTVEPEPNEPTRAPRCTAGCTGPHHMPQCELAGLLRY